jgi:hypothetical protein
LKIFISYSRRDAGDLAESLRDDLINGYGYDVFTDVKNIEEGGIHGVRQSKKI